jgi:RimJ/RimL family protein N-acetyltransferase
MLLKGEKVSLRPMEKEEINLFYKWATESDAAPFWYGKAYGNRIPTLEEFLEDWQPHYFSDADPELGRCFVILLEDKVIGQVNYNRIDPEKRNVEIDIIIANAEHHGKGYGSDSIRTLVKYLFEQMDVKEVWVAALKKNPRAIRAYQKSGFNIIDPPEHIKDDPHWVKQNLEDWVFLSCKG